MHHTILSYIDVGILKNIAKQGSETDISYYNRKSGNDVFTFLQPIRFPERIVPLALAASVSDAAIVDVDKIDRDLGEVLVTLESFNVEKGLFIGEEENIKKVKMLLKDTPMQNYLTSRKNIENILDFLQSLGERIEEGEGYVVVDQSFSVKGVGTVVLGFVKEGSIKKHQELRIFPGQKSTEIKSIQMQDVDVENAPVGARVGLALKGVEPSDVERGSILASHERFMTSSSIRLRIKKSQAIKDELYNGAKVQVYTNMGKYAATVSDISNNIILIDLEQEIAITEDYYVIGQQEKMPRIYGGGKIFR
ncbi:MAG: EF-Tu/IF-2/RF-3 family GTPase [Thermoplasmata archaeon]